jgi:hypothetical protein
VRALLGQAPEAHPVGHRTVVVPACTVGLAHATIVARRPRVTAAGRGPVPHRSDPTTAAVPVARAARTARSGTTTRAGSMPSTRSTRPNEGEHRSPRSVTP